MKIHTLALPKTGVEKWYIGGDWHSEHLHKPSYRILIDHALLTTKNKLERRLIINGDFLDIPYGMAKNEDYKFWKSKAHNAEKFFLPEWEAEAKIGNDLLDELQSVFSQIIWVGGNHDQPRLNNIKKCVGAGYEHAFSIKGQLHLDKRMIPFIEYNDWLDFGSLSITHGMAHGNTACKKHYEKSKSRNVIFSHVHQFEVKSFHGRGDTIQVTSLPAMCNLNPEYMKNTDNNWSNGFGEILMKANGNFNLNVHQVWDDELILSDGTILSGVK